MGSALLVAALAMPSIGRAQALQKERGQVRAQLDAQRAALAAMRGEEINVNEALALIQTLARASAQRTSTVTIEARAVEKRLELAEIRDGLAREALRDQLVRMRPRLAALYRITRRSRLDLLLSAPDLSQLFWRGWAMRKLLAADLALAEETQAIARYQDRARRRLEALRATVKVQRQLLGEIGQRERENALELQDALSSIQARGRASRESVKELERAERELGMLIHQLERAPAGSGFGALRGKLPLPTSGLVEVGFGQVLNPKFNTVVDHKGVDIRAPQGTAVRAVADGRVAWTGWLRGYGNLLILDHGGGYHTLMAHLGGLERSVGDAVKAGDEIARVGDTGSLKGSYLYFEVRIRGLAVDPASWLSSL